MSVNKKLVFSSDARNKILKGILRCGEVVKTTYGPNGRLTVVDKGTVPYTTKDGIKTLKEISFKDELENMGASLIKEASDKANYQNGDGSTGTAILTASLCKSANSLINKGMDANKVKEGFSLALREVLSIVEENTSKIKTEEDINRIAYISANNDEEIAGYITDAFTNIGDDGVIVIVDSLSRSGKTDIRYMTGCEIPSGYQSSKSVNDPTSGLCTLHKPLIVLFSLPINEFEVIKPIMKYATAKKRGLVIIAPQFSEECYTGFYDNIAKKSLEGSLVKAYGASISEIDSNLQDLAVLLDAKIIDKDVNIEDFSFENDSGNCETILIGPKKTEIIEPSTDDEKVKDYIKELQERKDIDEVDLALSAFEEQKIQERIARLSGGIATIYVGARTAPELGEKKDRYEDAINAVRAALKEGIVPGGSTSLLRAAGKAYTNLLKDSSIIDPSIIQAIHAFCEAIKIPAKLLIASSDMSVDSIIPEIISEQNFNIGFNSKTKQIENLIESKVIDPSKVVRNSLIYAENVAETFMMIDCAIISDLGNLSISDSEGFLADTFFQT